MFMGRSRHIISLSTKASTGLSGSVDNKVVFAGVQMSGVDAKAPGWVGIGTGGYDASGTVQFDRFAMDLDAQRRD